MPINTNQIPKEVAFIAQTLESAGFEAFLVGGCVRDLLLNKKPNDWDITTNANPEQIIALFPHTFYENDFGTVGVVVDGALDETISKIEITPYRLEGKYSDNRRPDEVFFTDNLEDDLKRRDFSINAMAFSFSKGLVDYHNGQKDLTEGIIRTVGVPDERFGEDALRILRAVRFYSQTGFTVSHETEKSILENGYLLLNISKERIRDEFIKIIMSDRPMEGILLMKKLNILQYVLPELLDCVDVEQNKAHSFDVFEHLLRSLAHSAIKNYPLEVRLSALFHDISKPESRRWSDEQKQWTFYGHEVIGARKTKKILQNLKFPNDIVEKVTKLVRWHMFFSDTEQISLSAVRRMISNVGKDLIWTLMDVRICDRIGTGRPKEDPYRLRKYHSMIEEALRDPVSVSMLKIDGNTIMKSLNIKPGPKIGYILYALLDDVLNDPKKNTEEYLLNRAVELSTLSDEVLKEMGDKGKELKEEEDDKVLEQIKKKYSVK